ncbi:MAG: Gfo/Idh/MocA family oxidoreductase [Bacteroidia bacterium]|nr:Gfo/Idh/MocA family oxidoreductase [Bacteroidia bacterium]
MASLSRRKFVRTLTSGAAAALALHQVHAAHPSAELLLPDWQTPAANDRIRIAAIGAGIMGFNNMRSSLQVPGVELAAVCDLYEGHLTRAKEVFGSHLITTRDYRELLSRTDIDAVLVSTSDHWHDRIAIDALMAGKHVYCEKPLVNDPQKGQALLDAEKKSGKILQTGSQVVSSIATDKARELYAAGAIGQLVMIETFNDRDSAGGAWQYSIPTDASPQTVDWDRFLGSAPKMPFDKTRFFRWRNYKDYGTGAAGDLFVHLFSRFHRVTDSLGPERAYATGGLHFWKDGRDVPDVIMALYDYPEAPTHPAFHVQMRVNFVAGGGGGYLVKLVGTEGMMLLEGDTIRLSNNGLFTTPTYGGWDSFDTFSLAEQQAFEAWYKKTYPNIAGSGMKGPGEQVFSAPEGYSDHYHHHFNFYAAIRANTRVVEDTAFGLRAAGPALLANMSYFEKKVIRWDPKAIRVI